MKMPHKNLCILHGTCLHGCIPIWTIGRKIAYPTPGFNGRPQLKNARDPAGVTWWGGKVSGGGVSPKIWRPYAGLWSANEGRVDCDEGSHLISHSGGIVICKWFRKLLPLPICGTSGPKGHTTIPSGTNGGVCTDWGWITAAHISGLR